MLCLKWGREYTYAEKIKTFAYRAFILQICKIAKMAWGKEISMEKKLN